MDRQLYPDALRAVSLLRIVAYHFFSWQLLTYFPSLGIMFALAGLFVAHSLKDRNVVLVVVQRLARLLPIWWTFAFLSLLCAFFYMQGAGETLSPSRLWLFPLEEVSWNVDTTYSNDVTVVTWYIAAYLWFLLFSPLAMELYKRLSWLLVFGPVAALVGYHHLLEAGLVNELNRTAFNVLTFSGCWMLGFAKADGSLDRLPKYLVYLTAISFSAVGIFWTYGDGTLSENQIALGVTSFGVAMFLLSLNPKLDWLPSWCRWLISLVNARAVTIYLFHNPLIDAAFYVGGQLQVYDLGRSISEQHGSSIGNLLCFGILAVLLFITVKTIGLVEAKRWLPSSKPQPNGASPVAV